MKIETLFFVTLFSVGTSALCNERNNLDIHWCIDRKFSSEKKQLYCLQSLEEAQIIKRRFADILQRKKACLKCNPVIVDEDQYMNFYRSPFLVTEAFFAKGTGLNIHFVFKDGLAQLFEAYVAVEDENINDLRAIGTMVTTPKEAHLIARLRTKEFTEFWISP